MHYIFKIKFYHFTEKYVTLLDYFALQNFKNRPSVKIVTPAPTQPPTTRPPQIIPQRKFTPTKTNNFFSKSKEKEYVPPSPIPSPTTLPAPHSASSGVKSSHAAVNDNLPFYKEPGGIFKEHANSNDKYDDDDSSLADNELDQDPEDDLNPNLNLNQVAHNSNKSPNVKYSPHDGRQHFQQQNVPQAVYPTTNPNPFQFVQQQQQPVGIGFIQPHQPQNIYFQPVAPTPYYQPQGQIYPTQGAPAFVPIQQIQGYQHHQQQQPLAAPPIYHHQQQQQQQPPPRRKSSRDRDHYAAQPIAPKPINRDNFPSPDDPDSDTFYGDPRPNTAKSNNNKNNPQPPPQRNSVPPPVPPNNRNNNNRNQQQSKNSKNNNTNNKRRQDPPPNSDRRRGPDEETEENDEEEEEEEEEEPVRAKPPPPQPPRRQPPPQNQVQHRNSKPNKNDRSDDYDTDYIDEGEGDRRPNNNNNQRNRGNNDNRRDYDGDFNNQRPIYDQPSHQGGRNRGGGGGGGGPGHFRASPVDRGPIRPSNHDFNSPNFDHPNIQYPNKERGSSVPHNNQPLFNRGPEYDPRGFGVGFGPAPRANILLDPIYTRTIKQYDEENKKPPQQQQRPAQPIRNNNNR